MHHRKQFEIYCGKVEERERADVIDKRSHPNIQVDFLDLHLKCRRKKKEIKNEWEQA